MSLGMTLVVKKVKGKLYVYEQYRVNGQVYTRYIGPLGGGEDIPDT
ncbi:MAG: putative integrase [Thermosphaera sp.]